MSRSARLCMLSAALWLLTAAPVGSAVAAPPAAQRFALVPGESQVIYRVSEIFISEGNRLNVAVGITAAVRGEIVVDRANPAASRVGSIQVDISQFRSDSQRRDNAIRRRWLESTRFPIAEFVPTSIDGLPSAFAEGRELTLRISGTLKVRDVVRPAVFETTLVVRGDLLTGSATTTVRMTDFGFDPPAILGILRTENEVRIEFRFVARAAS